MKRSCSFAEEDEFFTSNKCQKQQTFCVDENKLFASIKNEILTMDNLDAMLLRVKYDVITKKADKCFHDDVDKTIKQLSKCTLHFCELMDVNPTTNIMTAIMRTNFDDAKCELVEYNINSAENIASGDKFEYLCNYDNTIKKFGKREKYVCSFLFEFHKTYVKVSYYETPVILIHNGDYILDQFKIFEITNQFENWYEYSDDCNEHPDEKIDKCSDELIFNGLIYTEEEDWYQRDSFS